MRTILAATILLAAGPLAAGPVVFGEYLEVRSGGIWPGPAGEGVPGESAVLAWSVNAGAWDGEDLAGLSVVAAVRREADPGADGEIRARSILYVDARAGEGAGRALLSVVRELAGDALGQILEVRRLPIASSRDGDETTVAVGDVLKLRARALRLCCDAHAGSAPAGSPSLARTDHASCAIALEDVHGDLWPAPAATDPWRRSAVFGEFSL